jgi:peptide/nickel transport system substrate-binding protein
MNRRSLVGAVAITAASALALTGCSAGGSSGKNPSASAKTLVVDNTFDLKHADPAQAFELTGSIVDKAVYETALTFTGSDVTKPQPQIATYTQSADNKTLTLKLNGKHVFSSGNPVTADDIVWSYKRVEALNGNPAFLLQDAAGKFVTVTKSGADSVTLTSSAPNPQLPYILPNPSLGILDSKTLAKHGGTATKDDKAGTYLDGQSAGSGPYIIQSYDVKTKVVFGPNPKYVGTKPVYGRVVLQNVQGPQQKINVQGGQANVALNLNADQVQGLGSGSTKVVKGTSPDVFYLWLNQNASVSQGITNKQDFITAVRKGIDYKKILELTGAGSTQPGGMVPSQFLGAIKPDATNSTDTQAAIAALNKSGYKGQPITFSYPSDSAINGIDLKTVAQALQAQLKTIGVNLKLSGTPFSTFIDAYRGGKLQSGLMYWGPDFPDPADYVVFSPGESLGLRAGWSKDMAPNVTQAKQAALAASGADNRATAYGTWQRVANSSGPFVPLVQPGQYLVTTSSVNSIAANAVWTVDLAAIR